MPKCAGGCKKLLKSLVDSKKMPTFASSRINPLARRDMSTTKKTTRAIEVLAFQRGLQQATIVTDGDETRSFTQEACKCHKNLNSAISHLEAQGYRIISDGSW